MSSLFSPLFPPFFPPLLQHLPILPVVIPLLVSALLLFLRDSRHRTRLTLAALSCAAQLLAALMLLAMTTGSFAEQWPQSIAVYLLGDWPAPFGIVFVADRLAAIMLVLGAVLGCAALPYAAVRWERAGVHFLPLYQLLLMGINGAFLTGDLFNLFVFFEILLAASYGLVLHGSGELRVAAGLHYIATNLIASFLLLIALAIIYGVSGTLNMAELALRAGELAHGNRPLFEAAAAILGVAFLIKAAAWPLNFWLPATYAHASPPVAAVFAIMTKVGIYALLRVGSLLLPSGAPAAFGGEWMYAVGLATLLFGTMGLLAVQQAERMIGYCVILSSGTLLAALGMPGVTLTGPALFYLINSVLAIGAFYLLIEMVERTRRFGADVLAVSLEAFDLEDDAAPDHSDDVVGVAIPAAMAFLGMAFVCCALLVSGLPPLSGFVAKFTILSAAVQASGGDAPPLAAWSLVACVLASGLAGILALTRTGMRLFWGAEDRVTPRLHLAEAAPVGALLLLCLALGFWVQPVMAFMDETAQRLNQPQDYIRAVLETPSIRQLPGQLPGQLRGQPQGQPPGTRTP